VCYGPWGSVCVCVCVCMHVHPGEVCVCTVLHVSCICMYTPGKCVCVLHVCKHIPGKCVCVYCVTCVLCMHVHPREVCVCVLCMHIQQSLFQSCEHVSDCEPMCKHVFLSVNERCVGAYEQMCVSLCE